MPQTPAPMNTILANRRLVTLSSPSPVINLVGRVSIPHASAHEPKRVIEAVDFLQQRIHRCPTPCLVRVGPPVVAEAAPDLLFDTTVELAHGVVDDGGAGAVGDFVSSAEDPRRPGVVAL